MIVQSTAASLGIILIYLPSSPEFSPNSYSFPFCLSPSSSSSFFLPPLPSPLGEIRQRHLAFRREKDRENVKRKRRNRLLIFCRTVSRGLSWLFDTREFFSFPRASCIELFLPPCFSTSEEGERNVPDKSGRTGPSGSRRRWRKEFRLNGRKGFFGEIRRSTRETRKTRERTVGSRKNESTKNVNLCSLPFRHG